MKAVSALLLLGAAGPVGAQSAELKPATIEAFEQYRRTAEARIGQRVHDPDRFLWGDEVPDRRQQVRSGQIVTQSWNLKGEVAIRDGLVHDWIGAVFIPGTTIERTLALVQDYRHHQDVYKPEVIGSKLISRNGNEFNVFLRLLKKKVITVVLDSDHDVRYFRLDDQHWYSRSYSTRISELENAGKPNEHALPPGKDHGFLWRLDSYWRFAGRDGGVYVECEAVSLTRSVPTGLGWLIEPIIRNLPRESLANTLRKTRDALAH